MREGGREREEQNVNIVMEENKSSMRKSPSFISNESTKRSSNLTNASASLTSKPNVNARTKSAAFWSELGSVVSLDV